jgi:kynurenine formamidase
MRIIDLSQPLACGRDIVCEVPAQLPVYEGFPCEEYRYAFRSHMGCYFETSAHLFRGGTMTCDVPLEKLFLPALVPRLSPDRGGAIEPEEIEQALKSPVRRGDALLVNTQGNEKRHFSRRSGVWMAEKGVSLLGASMPLFDTGFVNPTGIFVELFKAEIPIIANLRNVSEIQHERIFLIVLPLNVERICTVPCRVVALDGEEGEVEWLVEHLRTEPA